MSEPVPTLPIEPACARSVVSRWRFELLDLFGITTLAAIATALVLALPAKPPEDRVFLAMILAGTVLGIILGRGLGGTGIVLGACFAGIAAAAAMGMFQSAPWETYNHGLRSAAVKFWGSTPSPFLPTIALCIAFGVIAGWTLAAVYIAVGALITVGPSGCAMSIRRHWLRFGMTLMPPLILAVLIGTSIAHAIQGPKQRAANSLIYFPNSRSQSRIAVSPNGKWWALESDSIPGLFSSPQGPHIWILYLLKENELIQQVELGEKVAGEICFAPQGDFLVHSTMRQTAIIRHLPTGEIVCFIDDSLEIGAIELFDWTETGLIVVHRKDSKLWLDLLRFDGTRIERQQRYLAGDENDRVVAFGGKADWIAYQDMFGVQDAGELVVKRLIDGKPLRKLEVDGHAIRPKGHQQRRQALHGRGPCISSLYDE